MRFLAVIVVAVSLLAVTLTPAFAGDSPGVALAEILHRKGILDDSSYSEVRKAGESGEQALCGKLVDILHRKGILDDATFLSLSQQAVAETAAPAVPLASPAEAKPVEAARPLDKELGQLEEGFARLGGDKVKLKIGSWIQLGWLNDDAGSSTYFPGVANGFSPTAGNQFFARYARLYFNGMLGDKIGFRVMFDAAPTSSTVFRDAYVFFDYIPYARVTIGQYLTPFGDEVWRAPFEVPVINYAMASTFIQIPTSRSLGVMLSGKYQNMVSDLPVGGGYAVSLINGPVASGTTTGTDDNDAKDVIGRAWINPFVPGLSVGGSWYLGKTRHVIAGLESKKDHDRWAAELDYAPPFAKGLAIRGEYLWQRRFFDSYVAPVTAFNRYTHATGWYAMVSYRINDMPGMLRYLNDIEPLVRYERFDEDASTQTSVARNDTRTKTTIGLNYYFNKYIRWMANYEIIHADGGLRSRSLQNFDNFGHHVFTTNLQVWF